MPTQLHFFIPVTGDPF